MTRLIFIAAMFGLVLSGCNTVQSGIAPGNAEAERARQDKHIYQERAEAKLRELDRQIEDLKIRLMKTTDKDERGRRSQEMTELRRKREIANEKLERLKTSSQEAWVDMKAGIDAAMDDLSAAYKRADSHFN